ncbi:uncharacterized protein LOC104433794 [Eucalyptus grandis]|uniref:Uncharacterized protein n=3 Tax=Eucalyptus TaxID=3932 RepID=A0A059D9K9_EUCGR|nr:uncharacterized protein LOC104433794 [Eucalyptus grandis]KAK3443512.1 hypothetical protein EUGRSUZ_B03628 [Eucalyptus grandis]
MARYYYNRYSILEHLSFPLHLCFFVLVLFLVLGFSWYINYEYMFEDLVTQMKLFLMLCPIVLLLVVHFLSAADRRRVPLIVSLPEKESLHRAGGSPWGVALLLVFLLYLISHQSTFHVRWFPLVTRRS